MFLDKIFANKQDSNLKVFIKGAVLTFLIGITYFWIMIFWYRIKEGQFRYSFSETMLIFLGCMLGVALISLMSGIVYLLGHLAGKDLKKEVNIYRKNKIKK